MVARRTSFALIVSGALVLLGSASSLLASRAAAAAPRPPTVLEVTALVRRGLAAQARGHLEEASALLDEALAADPKWPEAWRSRGVLRSLRDDWKGAIADLRHAVELAPGYGDAWTALGFGQLVVGDTAGAVASCRRAVDIERDNFDNLVNLAEALYLTSDRAGGRALFREALSFVTNRTMIDRGPAGDFDLLVRQGQSSRLLAEARADLEADFAVATARRLEGLALLSGGKPREAMDSLADAAARARAAGQGPVEVTALMELGSVLAGAGKIDLAVAAIEKAAARAQELGDASRGVMALLALARVERSGYLAERSLTRLEAASALAQGAGRKDLGLLTDIMLSIHLAGEGRAQQALRHGHAALETLARIHNPALRFTVLRSTGEAEIEGETNPPQPHHLEGRAHLEEAMTIAEHLLEDADEVMLRLGELHEQLGRPDRARAAYAQALASSRTAGNREVIGDALDALAGLEAHQGRFAEALALSEEWLALSPASPTAAPDPAERRRRIGREELTCALAYRVHDWPRALRHAEAAVSLVEASRVTGSRSGMRELAAATARAYRQLTAARGRNGDWAGALAAAELGRARALAEQLGGRGEPSTEAALRAELAPDTAALVLSRYEESQEVVMVVTPERTTGFFADEQRMIHDGVQRFGSGIEAMVRRLVADDETRRARIADPDARRRAADSFAREYLGKVTDHPEIFFEYARFLLRSQSPLSRGARRLPSSGEAPGAARAQELTDLLRFLHGWLVEPAGEALAGKTRWIVIPDGGLWAIPFDALVDPTGTPLAARIEIGYAYSLGVRSLLRKRPHAEGRAALLALGGARYAGGAANGGATEPGTSRAAYAALGLDHWNELPGALAEVKAIARLSSGAVTLTGADVNETRVKDLSVRGELARYRVLHFATHGIVVPESPALSALVLSQPPPPGGDDGYLTMAEIAGLRLDADFVVLSACETGLGRIYGGEGVVGLTQAFLVAGASGLAASLWPVSDQATSQFMTGVYDLVAREKIPHASAIARMKRRFLSGDFGDRYRAPYYWAAFAVYGQ